MTMIDGRGPAGAAYDALVDEIEHELNPSGDECWHCGGEGYTYDCIDGCCVDADSGCGVCAERCSECAMRERARLKAIREAVITANNVDLAIAWLKSIGRWRDDITRERVQSDLDKAGAALAAPPAADAPDAHPIPKPAHSGR